MNHVLQLLLLLAFIVIAAKLAGAAANRIGQPAVFGEILVGLILGPTVLNVLDWSVFQPGALPDHGVAPPRLYGVIHDLAELGVVLLMFIAGMETNLAEMRRVGTVALWAATGGVLVPLAGGIGVSWIFGLPLVWEGIFIGTILTATSVSISAQTLIELGQLRSKEGSTILGAAVIDDVQGIILLSLVVAFASTGGEAHVGDLGLVVVRMVAFFAAGIFLGRYFEGVATWAGRLGVSVQDLTPELAAHFGAKQGVLVSAVRDDSPASRAGIRVGDVITMAAGEPIESASDLRATLWRDPEATEVVVGLVRDKVTQSVTVTFEAAPVRQASPQCE